MEDLGINEGDEEVATDEPADEQEGDYTGVASAKTEKPDHPNADENGIVEVSIPYDCGSNLDEAVERFGEEFVFDHFQTLFERKLQNKARRELKDGIPVEKVEELYSIENYDPKASRRGRSSEDPMTSAMKALGQLSDEEKAELREQLDL